MWLSAFASVLGRKTMYKVVILSKRSASKDLRTDLTANLILMRRFFDFTSFRSE